MKKRRAGFLLTLILCFLPGITAQQLPRPSGFVNDFAGVMNAADLQTIDKLARALKENTGAEMAVAAVKSFAPYASIDEYSLALASAWGIGEKGKDNGVLLILAMEERRVKIEVGYGLEGAIPDSLAGRILDMVILPLFRENDFSGGLTEGSKAIAAVVAKEYGMSPEDLDLPEEYRQYGAESYVFPSALIPVVIPIIFILIQFLIVYSIRRRFKGGGRIYSSGSFGSGIRFSGSGRSSGRSFGGFGGGGFGGGGASRGF